CTGTVMLSPSAKPLREEVQLAREPVGAADSGAAVAVCWACTAAGATIEAARQADIVMAAKWRILRPEYCVMARQLLRVPLRPPLCGAVHQAEPAVCLPTLHRRVLLQVR